MKATVTELLESRGIKISNEDREPVESHWTKMQSLRAQVDESLLADNEIAVNFNAAQAQHE